MRRRADSMKDSEHPFFRPLWRRVAIVAVCLGWAGVEFATGVPFWGTIALGFAGYAVWQFFYLYKPADKGKASAEAEPEASADTEPKE
jgi:cbb3-type cytochrome oxidase subunit 3